MSGATDAATGGHGGAMPASDSLSLPIERPHSLAPTTESLPPEGAYPPASSPSLCAPAFSPPFSPAPPAPPAPPRAPREHPVADARSKEAARAARAAFRAMYEQNVDFVWRNLRRIGVHEAEVDDKTQEVFVIAHRRFDDFADRGHGPRAWLFQIVLRVASDARRHRRRHPEDADGGVAQERQSVEPPQTVAVQRREQLDCLDRALCTIEVGRRAVLVLHEIEEMTAPEIAETLAIPLNTVYSRLRVARGELEAAIAKDASERGAHGDVR